MTDPPAVGARRRPSGEAPPVPHSFSRAARASLTVAALVFVAWVVVLAVPSLRSWVSDLGGEWEVAIAGRGPDWMDTVAERFHDVIYGWGAAVIGWVTVVTLVVARRLRHALVFLLSLGLAAGVTFEVAQAIERPRPYGVEILGRWDGFGHPAWTVAVLGAALAGAVISLAPPGRWRRALRPAAALALVAYAVAELHLGLAHPGDVLIGAAFGLTIAVLAFGLLVPADAFPVTYRGGNTAHLDVTGARGQAIRGAIEDQLGLEITALKPIGLEGSAGSTPLRLTVAGSSDDPADVRYLFAKLYAKTHLQSDRWYKLGRTLMYGRLEDEHKFGTVRRLVEYEDYLGLKMADAEIRVPRTYGIVEITPDREYVIVTDFLDGYVEIGDAEVDVEVIDRALAVVRRLWDVGLAHRDIKPSNLMVKGSEVAVIDVAFGQIRPSPWRQAIDLANMMLVLALRSDATVVYERAVLQFSPEEIGEAFAASRGVTLPSQVRQQVRSDGRDLAGEFRALAPPTPRVRIQVLSWRRVALTVGVLVVGVLAIVFGFGFLETAGMLP